VSLGSGRPSPTNLKKKSLYENFHSLEIWPFNINLIFFFTLTKTKDFRKE
jgi:hypothetical protein